MLRKTFLHWEILISGLIILSAVGIGLLIIKDPFNLKYGNLRVHLKPDAIESLSSSIIDECATQYKHECYKQKLIALTKLYGFATSEAILASMQDKDEIAKNCHILAHNMSHEAYVRSPWQFYKLIDNVNVNACGSGYLHGILEAYTADHPEIAIDGTFANEICGRSNDEYRQKMCVHFIGHILIINTYGNLEEALPVCETIKKEWQFDCYNGLFMEDHQKLMLAEHGILPLPPNETSYVEQLEKQCSRYSGIMGAACWTEMAEIYAHTYGYDPDIIFKGCSKAETKQFAVQCYYKGTIAMSVYHTFDKPGALTPMCKYYENDRHTYIGCVRVITSSLMMYSPKFISRGESFCSTIPSTYQEECYSSLMDMLKVVVKNPQERIDYCTVLPEKYRQSCSA